VIVETKDARREDNKELKKMLKESLNRINSLETITKLLVEVEKDQKSKMEWLAAQFHLYLHYVHHMDITPADGYEVPSHIRKTRTIRRRRKTRAKQMVGRKTSLSWTSEWLVEWLVRSRPYRA
jgi:hypothetical protein